jgi:sensor histidine kinase regulating citrate/malate metabolism
VVIRSGQRRKRWSLAKQLLVLQVVIVSVLVIAGVTLTYLDARRGADRRARDVVTAVAATLAGAPNLRAALAPPDPSRELQPFAERERASTGVDFITIMNPQGIRYTHPHPDQIGKPYIGHTQEALSGRLYTETYTGTLGPSVRTTAPVFDDRHQVVALVSVGITVRAIAAELQRRLLTLIAVAAAVLAVGIVGSWLVSARLRRQTRGVAPEELREMFEYRQAILHSVREGLVLLDREGRVVLCNSAARELLDLRCDPQGHPAAALGLEPELTAALVCPERHLTDEGYVGDTRVLVINTVPVRSGDRSMGNVVTLRDHTELQALTGELKTARGYAESLHAQAHEAANRMHTMVCLIETGQFEQAVEFATAELKATQQLIDRVKCTVADPILAALLIAKSAEASERGVELVITDDTAVDGIDGVIESLDLVTIVANLINNAVDAAIERSHAHSPRVVVTARTENSELTLQVSDSGLGVDPESAEKMFQKGWSTKQSGGPFGRGLGLALVGCVLRRYRGSIDVSQGVGAVFTVRLSLERTSTSGQCVNSRGRGDRGPVRAASSAGPA